MQDEKFLGGYHTHPRENSYASAEDLRYCGIFKIICTGGLDDNKIRCNTWKHEQQSVEDHNKMIYDIDKGVTKSNHKYQPNFDCIRTMGSLFSEEKYIKENLDKDLNKKELYILNLNKYGIPEYKIQEAVNELINDTIQRNKYANKLKEEIKNESKKYYNEIEIK